MNNYFPLNINLNNKICVVIGAGKVAERKINKLMNYFPMIQIIAKEIKSVKINELINSGKINFVNEEFNYKFTKNAFLIITATDNKQLNDEIAKKLIKKNVLVNNVSGEGNVLFPAVFQNDNIIISVSTNGEDPKIAKEIRDKIKSNFEIINHKEK